MTALVIKEQIVIEEQISWVRFSQKQQTHDFCSLENATLKLPADKCNRIKY